MADQPASRVPDVDAAIEWLADVDDPLATLVLGTARVDPPIAGRADAIERALEAPAIRAGLAAQRPDGSWGDGDRAAQRVLPTLRMVQTLADLGLGRIDEWHQAVGFLAEVAHVDGGPFSVDGRRHNVLSCYVGIAATAYLLGDRTDLAEPQLEWIAAHQDVRVDGTCRLSDEPEHWDDRLATRFGGCMASTTCLLGLVKIGRALALGTSDAGRRSELRAAIREVLLERRLMHRRDGRIVPLGATDARADEWLQPTFPLDYHTDLVEVLDVVRRSGPADARTQPAIEHLAAMQLADGSWPLRRTFRPDHLPALERRSRTRGSPITTARAVAALL